MRFRETEFDLGGEGVDPRLAIVSQQHPSPPIRRQTRNFCGEGAPDWAVELPEGTPPFPEPMIPGGIPIEPNTVSLEFMMFLTATRMT